MKWIVLAATFVAGCAHTGRGPDAVAAAPEAVYALPSGGAVRFAVLGMRDVPAERLGQEGFRALVVRMTLDNRSGSAPVSVVPNEQIARISNYGPLLPAKAPSTPVQVGPGGQAALELLYPVPRPDYGPEMPRDVAVDWRVRMPDAVVQQRAVLDRQLAQAMRNQL
jgi:hypothetical protein